MQCGAGARTLSQYGDHVYPDTGNGGYTSLHTDVGGSTGVGRPSRCRSGVDALVDAPDRVT
jgi:hypothetical protein